MSVPHPMARCINCGQMHIEHDRAGDTYICAGTTGVRFQAAPETPPADLVERLRARKERCRDMGMSWDEPDTLCNKAADVIQSQATALWEAEEALSLAVRVPFADPAIASEVRAMCERFGYGNVMATASAIWREELGDLAGVEFCSGPCRTTAERALTNIRKITGGGE